MAMLVRDLAPDLILYNGRVVTLAEALPRCAALACKDGRVVALGDDGEVRALAGPGTEQLDLDGRMAIPGFNDAHNHMLHMGLKFAHLQLDDCTSIAEMVERVRAWAARTPHGHWIVGEGWNESLFAEGRLPTRHDLDAATDAHPVVLMRFFNLDVVNSAALALARVDARTPDPAGGKIERDADGSPSGLLRASAKALVRRLLPEPAMPELIGAIEAASRAYLEVGITSVLDPGLLPDEIRAYQHAYRQGRLHVRANLLPSWHGFLDTEGEAELMARAAALGVFSGLGDDRLRLGALKMALDGGTTSRTAWMFQPFLGEDEVRDYHRLDPADLRRYFAAGHALGWDIGIHAIGDRAHHEAAAAFADVLARSEAGADHRHSLIHAYFATEESLRQMAAHDLAAVIQPTFIYFEGDDLFRDVGPELAGRYKPMRTYLDRGIRVVATSDVPSTVDYNPFIGLYSLVTRKSRLGTPIAPREAVSREEALHAYTVAGAWLTREEGRKGRLAPGYLADLAVLDRDYFACPAEEIKDIRVELTVVDGRVAWRRERHAQA
jgi:predicted amidohydrolase YtcJ